MTCGFKVEGSFIVLTRESVFTFLIPVRAEEACYVVRVGIPASAHDQYLMHVTETVNPLSQ